MKPGQTNLPLASMVRDAADPASRPTAAILPSRMATSAYRAGLPAPSMTRPPVISRSYGCAIESPAQTRSSTADLFIGLWRLLDYYRSIGETAVELQGHAQPCRVLLARDLHDAEL